MADLGECLDRRIAALAREPVLAGDDQHVLCHPGIDEMMRQHGHGEPRSAADLDGIAIAMSKKRRWNFFSIQFNFQFSIFNFFL